jgi:hypothetical protein
MLIFEPGVLRKLFGSDYNQISVIPIDVIMSTPGAIELTRVEVAVDTDSAIATCEFEGITDNGDIFGNQVSDITPKFTPEAVAVMVLAPPTDSE